MCESFDTMSAIVLAGGKGQRFRGQKQFALLDGTPLWEIVRNKVAQVLKSDHIVVVGVDVPGGETRTQSVIHGMRALRAETTRVIVLEAARPLVRMDQIRELLCAPEPSVSFVLPLVNTVFICWAMVSERGTRSWPVCARSSGRAGTSGSTRL